MRDTELMQSAIRQAIDQRFNGFREEDNSGPMPFLVY
jgi:hypothetical protein